ncbi:MAG: NADP-dependent malic enzyme [Acidobacteriota bacterium]|nr:NADP-dependent malic enzyme [Acidobacteriota bacterium]MDH3523168.1 NADP-dependent malic enzyme [Acidobacteriota bacterium]
MIREQDALEYHARGRRGKLEVVASKPCATQRDLALAYTPGVAVPCRKIQASPELAYEYTGKGNLVAVVSNGTAVLGLGDIGALAGKPVMEGKGVLFKRFADIDVFDLEVDSHDPAEIVRTVELVAPTFGGINLEDIKAPECFFVEEELKRRLDIPVFHDDQHGTAIISGAALLNALEIADKEIGEVKVVFSGAGAAGIACAEFYLKLGVRRGNILLCDSAGVVFEGRERGMNPYKERFAAATGARTLADALAGADVFVGLSGPDLVTPDMVRSMAARPIVFAMANPDPEITYDAARAARPDVIMATGRSDYPNQVNNVLGFPFIFRGALDVRATCINEEMKLAAARALAALAKEDVPDSVMKAYGLGRLRFGPEYLIPKPFDHRVLIWEAAAVAQAAMETGVAQIEVEIEDYKLALERRLGKAREVMRGVINRARRQPKRVVFPEGVREKVLRAAQIIVDEGFAHPILLGPEAEIRRAIEQLELHLDPAAVTIVDPATSPAAASYADRLHVLRRRKGMTLSRAREMVVRPTIYGALMVRYGEADALVAGVAQHLPDTLRPALEIIQVRDGVCRAASVFILILKERILFFADPMVNIDPSAEELAEIALLAAEEARRFGFTPRVAMISFSNFGYSRHPFARRVQRATEIVRRRAPGLLVDGEMQAQVAIVPELAQEVFSFSPLEGRANVLVFPDLQSANAAYQLAYRLSGGEAIGPVLTGMRQPVHVLQHGAEVKDIVLGAAIAVVDAQKSEIPKVAELEAVPV